MSFPTVTTAAVISPSLTEQSSGRPPATAPNSNQPKFSPITATFTLPATLAEQILAQTAHFGFDGLGEAVFYRTYAREENWPQTVLRIVQGIIELRKDHYLRHGLPWVDSDYYPLALEMAQAMNDFRFLPAGRGLWAIGRQQVRLRGSAAANNCGAVHVHMLLETEWITLMLGNGMGVGSRLDWDGQCVAPIGTEPYVVQDSIEGWAKSVRDLCAAYRHGTKLPLFDYSLIRPKGTPLKIFGGISGGAEPLIQLHRRTNIFFRAYLHKSWSQLARELYREGFADCWVHTSDSQDPLRSGELITDYNERKGYHYSNNPRKAGQVYTEAEFVHITENSCPGNDCHNMRKQYDATRCAADIINSIGFCIVSANIRRSSEILLAQPDNQTFLQLKNEQINPERRLISGLSNNTILIDQQFFTRPEQLAQFCSSVKNNGEPGLLNLQQVQSCGRVGQTTAIGREAEADLATVANPCSEIPLEPYEICNLAEVFISNCSTIEQFLRTVKLATFFTQTVSLIYTVSPETNAVIERNRRTGVSLSGIAQFYEQRGKDTLVQFLDQGYALVRAENTRLAQDAGVVPSIRVTTVKPSGTVSIVAGTTAGVHYPVDSYAERRIRVAENSPLVPWLRACGYPEETVDGDVNTLIFIFPYYSGCRPVGQVSLREQFELLTLVQKHWADNMVSVTLSFRPETGELEQTLPQFLPLIKSCSFYPLKQQTIYRQMPFTSITEQQYQALKNRITKIPLAQFLARQRTAVLFEGKEPKYCDGDNCEVGGGK